MLAIFSLRDGIHLQNYSFVSQNTIIPFIHKMLSEIITNNQIASKLWASYIVITIAALVELTYNKFLLHKRVEELKIKYAEKLNILSEQEARISELEKRHVIIAQNFASKLENVFHLANNAIMRVELMDQTLKTHIIETTRPKSPLKAISTQTIEIVEDYDAEERRQFASIEDKIESETHERKRLTEITYNVLYDLLLFVYQGTQELGTRLSNLNIIFWNKNVVQNVFKPETTAEL